MQWKVNEVFSCRAQEICPYNHYKYNPIEKDGVLGSCETYDTRTAITKDDVQHLSLDAVEEK